MLTTKDIREALAEIIPDADSARLDQAATRLAADMAVRVILDRPDVLIRVMGGVADVQVNTVGIVAEMRDYDCDELPDDAPDRWFDENGELCLRYIVRGLGNVQGVLND